MSQVWLVKSQHSSECQRNSLVGHHWGSWWLCAVRQYTVSLANVDPLLCRYMVSPSHNDLTSAQVCEQLSKTKTAKPCARIFYFQMNHVIVWSKREWVKICHHQDSNISWLNDCDIGLWGRNAAKSINEVVLGLRGQINKWVCARYIKSQCIPTK